jgi:hypothetical protein
MRPRVDRRVILLVLLLAGAGWVLRAELRAAAWMLRGFTELLLLPSSSPPVQLPTPARIAHAGGAYRGMSYTNSLEALDFQYRRGVRWFEMDFSRDTHGEWWAVHDWSDVQRMLGVPLDSAGRGIPGGQRSGSAFQLMRLEHVMEWLEDHADARLVTDTKDDNRAFLTRISAVPSGLRSRIHPQIYRFSEYPMARAAEFGAPVFTTYKTSYPWSLIVRFAGRHPLLAVAVTRGEAMAACQALGGHVPLLAHTVDDSAEAARLEKLGIAGIFTDDLLP